MELGSILPLASAAVAAGFVDSVVGGGGLIQVPALFSALPGRAPIELLATNKVASVVGTSSAALQYARRIPPVWSHLSWGLIGAALGSWAGARTIPLIEPAVFKPIVLVLLIGVALYTFRNKRFGETQEDQVVDHGQIQVRIGLIGLAVGYYDGFLGPGTGSFFIFLLIRFLGYDFLRASAAAKILNVATNLAAISSFVLAGAVIWKLGILMAVCNLSGALLGSHVALTRGSGFVRKLFLAVVGVLICRMGFDVVASLAR